MRKMMFSLYIIAVSWRQAEGGRVIFIKEASGTKLERPGAKRGIGWLFGN